MFGAKKPLPVPDSLERKCPDCGSSLKWQVVEYVDPVIGIRKVDHYKAECANGHVHYRDQRGQVVEPAVENLAPDRSEFANSPQGPQPYSGFIEFVKQERAKAEALKAAQAKKAADAAAAAAAPAGASPAAAGAPAPAAAAPEAAAGT
ncbi:MAG: hypothetical protein QOK05_2416 [Chloroflexota bacterium]|jgi:hypothetical protein|nr:hypothetical protein [Chloroflexota bacterium]